MMALDSIDSARNLLVEIVSQPKFRAGVTGAVLGSEIARREGKAFYVAFGSKSLSDFIRTHCASVLTIERGEGDEIVRLPNEKPNPKPISKAFKINPKVWFAALRSDSPTTHLNRAGVPVHGEPPDPEGWAKIEPMPIERQQKVLDQTISSIEKFMEDERLRVVILEKMQEAKDSLAPILEFSRLMTGFYLVSQDWNLMRVGAVADYVQETTGVLLQPAPQPHMSAPRYSSIRQGRSAIEQVLDRAGAQKSAVKTTTMEVDSLREFVGRTVANMSYRDLLELKLPVESLIGFVPKS